MSARHQNSYHSKVSVSSLCFELVVQWENDTNQTCNILSTSCRCKRTITERSVKAKVFILRRLGSRQFLGANMTLFMCLLHILEVEQNQRNLQVKEGQGLVSPSQLSTKNFGFQLHVENGCFFFYVGCSWSSAFCSRFRVKKLPQAMTKTLLYFQPISEKELSPQSSKLTLDIPN